MQPNSHDAEINIFLFSSAVSGKTDVTAMLFIDIKKNCPK